MKVKLNAVSSPPPDLRNAYAKIYAIMKQRYIHSTIYCSTISFRSYKKMLNSDYLRTIPTLILKKENGPSSFRRKHILSNPFASPWIWFQTFNLPPTPRQHQGVAVTLAGNKSCGLNEMRFHRPHLTFEMHAHKPLQ